MTLTDSQVKPKKSPTARVDGGDRIWDTVIIFFGGLALVFSITTTGILFDQNFKRQYDALSGAGTRLTAVIDHELSMLAFGVEVMETMAKDLLEGRVRLTLEPTDSLSSMPKEGGYMLDVPPGYRDEQIGDLTGTGPIPQADTLAAKEMAMALALSPIFNAIIARGPDLAWVYYTSAQNFQYVHPRVGVNESTFKFYTPDMLKKHYFQGAMPQANPKHRVFWSPVYVDAAGKGPMVTVSKPVYLENNFLGSLSIDITTKTLDWLLQSYGVPMDSTVHLLGQDGRTLVNPGVLPERIAVAEIKPGTPTPLEDGAYITVFPLQTVDWYVAVRTPRRALQLNALEQSAPYGLVVLFLLSSLILIAMLSRTLRQTRILAVRDSLTGLYNRGYFDELSRIEFAHICRTGGCLGLAIMDIDYFKKYNDRYGHQAGDRILRAIAEVLNATLKRASDRLFRVGGEEFAVLVILDKPEQMAPLVEKLCVAVRALDIPHEASPLGQVTISVGATTISATNWIDVDAAYQRADKACYRAKESGRNRAELDPTSA